MITSPAGSPAAPPGAREWPLVVQIGSIAAAYFAAATLGLAFRTEPERLAIFWPPNGFLLGLLLLGSRRDRWVAVLTTSVTCLVANLFGGNSVPVSLGFTLVNLGEPCLAYWVLRRALKRPMRMERAGDVFVLGLTALATALVAAGPGAAVVVFGLGAPDYPGVFVDFWLADAMGVMIVTPLVLAWAGLSRGALRAAAPWRAVEAAALAATLVAAGVLIFGDGVRARYPLMSYSFPLFPLFVWAALRFGPRGTTAALFGVSLVAIWGTGRGHGPFAGPGVSPADRLLIVQFFLSSLGVASLALAAVMAERRAAEAALRASEERYREVTETIQEAFWVIRPDRRGVFYVSPAYERIWGRSCASLYADPGSFLDGVHPEDRSRVAAALARQTEGTYAEEYRVVRPDGSVRWVRSRAFPVRDAAGAVVRIVGVSKDVTERKDAEFAKEAVIEQLQRALAEIRTLRGLIPMCAWCRKVRDGDGLWRTVEEYIRAHTEASVTHGMCPACYTRMDVLIQSAET